MVLENGLWMSMGFILGILFMVVMEYRVRMIVDRLRVEGKLLNEPEEVKEEPEPEDSLALKPSKYRTAWDCPEPPPAVGTKKSTSLERRE